MARFLVRRALDLLENDLKSETTKAKKRKHAELNAAPKQSKVQQMTEMKKFNIISYPKTKKSPIEEYRSKHMVDRTEENLKILLRSKQLKPKSTAALKVLKFHEKEQKKRDIEPEVEIPEPESILFPELNKPKKKKKRNEWEE